MRSCSLTADGAELLFRTPYDPGLVAALKAQIPATDRRWDGAAKVWRVLPVHGQTCAALAAQYCRDTVHVPNMTPVVMPTEIKLFRVRYVGMTKARGGDDTAERSSFGLVDDVWALVFPENVLRAWFCDERRPNEERSLYSVMGVTSDVTDVELKMMYRRLAKHWHPDMAKEPDATEVFKAINHAYSILSDCTLRAKYEAGLALQRSVGSIASAQVATGGYRSPLRCGLVMCEGREVMGRFVASKVLAWEDITNWAGQVLVASWPLGATEPVEEWV